MRSSLDNPYWESAFYQARRLPKEYNAQITMNSDTCIWRRIAAKKSRSRAAAGGSAVNQNW